MQELDVFNVQYCVGPEIDYKDTFQTTILICGQEIVVTDRSTSMRGLVKEIIIRLRGSAYLSVLFALAAKRLSLILLGTEANGFCSLWLQSIHIWATFLITPKTQMSGLVILG